MTFKRVNGKMFIVDFVKVGEVSQYISQFRVVAGSKKLFNKKAGVYEILFYKD